MSMESQETYELMVFLSRKAMPETFSSFECTDWIEQARVRVVNVDERRAYAHREGARMTPSAALVQSGSGRKWWYNGSVTPYNLRRFVAHALAAPGRRVASTPTCALM